MFVLFHAYLDLCVGQHGILNIKYSSGNQGRTEGMPEGCAAMDPHWPARQAPDIALG